MTCSAEAGSLVVENGEIAGVTGIEIQGNLYDLRFADSSFNAGYPSGFAGYGTLAPEAANSVIAMSESGALADRRDLKLRGCETRDACTVLVPDHATGAAPSATISYACELIYSAGRFRPGDPQWPFDASVDTRYMPDMTYGILTRIR
ncbi:hypothetical protein [Imhoffiella purpurea]|nr:hypothetical protein [Imhoffiella purpurea]